MNIGKYFTIPWKGLSEGSHHFDFEADERLFDAFDSSDINGGKVSVSVDLERSATMLMLVFDINGEVTVECDRCLDELSFPIDYDGRLKVKFSEEIDDYDGEVLWMNPADGELDLTQYIYESIYLCLPYSRVHGEDADGNSLCNPEMLAKFSIISGEEFDRIAEEKGTGIGAAPGSDKLKELKEKLEAEENK